MPGIETSLQTVEEQVAALRRELRRTQLELSALQARVYSERPVMTDEDRDVKDKLLASLKKDREEAEQKALETPVVVDPEQWEKDWMVQ